MLDLTTIYRPGESMDFPFVVAAHDVVGNFSPQMCSLLSTTGILDRLLGVLREFCDKDLPEGYVTVSHSVSMEHLSAVLIGTGVNMEVTLDSLEGNKLNLTATLIDAEGPVVKMKTQRAVVNVHKLMEKVEEHAKVLAESE